MLLSSAAAPPGQRRGSDRVVGAHARLPARRHPDRVRRRAARRLPAAQRALPRSHRQEARGEARRGTKRQDNVVGKKSIQRAVKI